MLDTTPLDAAVDHFADRLRAAPQSRLQRGAAAQALALARELARRAQIIEGVEGGLREMNDAGMFAVADQVTVAGRDLAVALTGAEKAPEEGPGAGPGAGPEEGSGAGPGKISATREALAEAVALVEEAQRRAGV
ncbi:hypothetical protein [Streptomyces sp. KLOTTS4A1]|uniref:hypothetical protein n=1 Tax=Streptomyces sp. KLOTTS4A1 TaxID=3390996 RepID=UPI0039F4F4AF